MQHHHILLAVAALVAAAVPLHAQLAIPSDGSDGAFNPAASIEVDLSQAVTGIWSAPSSAPGKGIYDPAKWAIVFKYSSVTIPAGVTVTFKNHPSNPPVVWLVQGGVEIAGTVSVNGKPNLSGPDAITPVEAGPGGFRGGAKGPGGPGAGLGPGGGSGESGGGYSSLYGNPQILPLIGGSGGPGFPYNHGIYSGCGAGGAILIAAPGTVQLSGAITAISENGGGFGGSGGAVKIIANQVSGTGNLNAAGSGRVRIEANSLTATVTSNPPTIAVPPGATPTIFQSETAPTVKIVSVDGLPSPAEPTAPLITSADIGIEKNTAVTITLETRNFPIAGSVVSLRRALKFGGVEWRNATFVSGNNALATWQVSMTFGAGFQTLQARATAP